MALNIASLISYIKANMHQHSKDHFTILSSNDIHANIL